MQHKHQNKLFVRTPPTTHKVLNNFLRPPIAHANGNDILMGILELVLYSGRWRDLRNLGDCLDGRLFAPCRWPAQRGTEYICRCPAQRGTEYVGAPPKEVQNMKVPAQRGTGNQRGTESVLQMILILAAINV